MRIHAMLVGLVAWTLAIAVPAAYTVAIAFAAVQEDSYAYSIETLSKRFNAMPALMWLYTVATALVGTVMVAYGFTRPRIDEEMSL